MRLTDIIIRPIVTEKGVSLANTGKYIFEVRKDASKGAIASEVKRAFGVDVLKVSTMVVPGKKRRMGRTRKFKKTPSWKKAVVLVKEGQKIDLFPNEKV